MGVLETHKERDDAGIKLTTYATDVMGVSGQAMMGALIAGQSDSAALAELAKGRMRTRSRTCVKP